MLRPLAHSGHGQHISPYFEQEFTNLVAHRHVFEHVAHLDRVLDRQSFLLLHLLGHADNALSRTFLGQKLGQKLLEFFIDKLVHALAGFRVLLNHLNHALDLAFQRAVLNATRIKPHDAGTHAVNQLARGVVQRAKEIRLFQCHTQHRHLQTCKPDADSGRNAVFLQDRLKHQGHNFNGGFLALGFGFFLELGGLFTQPVCDSRHPSGRVLFKDGVAALVGVCAALGPHRQGRCQTRRRPQALRVGGESAVVAGTPHKQALELTHDTQGPAARARQRRRGGQHTGFFKRAGIRRIGALNAPIRPYHRSLGRHSARLTGGVRLCRALAHG